MTLPPRNPDEILRARGADSRPAARFEPYHTEREHDGWDILEDPALLPALDMVVRLQAPVAKATRAELNQDLLALLHKLPRQ